MKKLKLTLGFLIISAVVVFLAFRKDILSYRSLSGPEVLVQEGVSKDGIYNYFKTAELLDYRGGKTQISQGALDSSDRVIVHLWASWCSPCVNEVPDLIAFAQREKAKSSAKTTFIAVSLDETSDDLNKFLKSFPDFDTDTFHRVWDKGGGLSKLVNADRLPMTIMLVKGRTEPKIVRGVVDWKSVDLK